MGLHDTTTRSKGNPRGFATCRDTFPMFRLQLELWYLDDQALSPTVAKLVMPWLANCVCYSVCNCKTP